MGKYAGRMSGGGNLRGVPARDSDPLQAFRKEIEKRKRSNKRTVRLRLFPNRYEQETLFDIGLACARLWNELNYEKRQAFFNGELTPKKRDEINRRYYDPLPALKGGVLLGSRVLMLVRLLIRMMRLGTHSLSS
ncbi:MAG: hypothetical protein QXW41_08790 [Fervidicoccaceae archaeon]